MRDMFYARLAISGMRYVAMALIFIFLGLSGSISQALADDNRQVVPGRFGMSGTVGRSFSPNSEMDFLSLNGIYLMDFQRVWPFRAPENMRLKAEFSPGLIAHPDTKAIISAQVLALIYFTPLSTKTFMPFLEFGAGGLYLDYRVEGQGSRFNFVLLGGPGIQFTSGPLKDYFTSLRYHHISNGNLSSGNKAIDSLTLSVGYYF